MTGASCILLLHFCVVAVGLVLITFISMVPLMLESINEIEVSWRKDWAVLDQTGQVMWRNLMDLVEEVPPKRRRANTYEGILPSADEDYKYTHTLRPPDYGYGYAKLKCCCSYTSANSQVLESTLRVSYKCPIGPKGTRGPLGESGEPGLAGTPGFAGEDYPSLVQPVRNNYGIPSGLPEYIAVPMRDVDCGSCPFGEPGQPGARGPSGVPGKSGLHGLPGSSGSPGLPGELGARGRSGRAGVLGQAGLDGVKKAVGAPGQRGANGLSGMRGARGVAGQTGSMGQFGPRGNVGAQGVKGQRGMDGVDGAQGPAGEPGRDAFYCKCPSRQYNTGVYMQNTNEQARYSNSVPSGSNGYYKPVPYAKYDSTNHAQNTDYIKSVHIDDSFAQQIHKDYNMHTTPSYVTTSIGPPSQTPPADKYNNGISRYAHEAPKLPYEAKSIATTRRGQVETEIEVGELPELPFNINEDIDSVKKKSRHH
ncbi:collagen triple helix repeat (20 copies) domain-containing protein [Ditylenchus destructor]|uniref:Collagen triple helix repeat (20 copies) domain-containing protein n=1 Tax=Ditylenchus destructor TaxID=166010 RepID=A0AAD4NFH8_9BILA|nr:collagen triple helix repeat (20 copies) domain-containing protein [Ditylenchus destructor]